MTSEDNCVHIPAHPDVDFTLCWKCGVDIIADPETHLWRPLTAAENLLRHELIRQLRDLFLSVHSSEFSVILWERLQHRSTAQSIRLAENFLKRWVIVNGAHEDLAWSGTHWVPHRQGIPTGDVQICNFDSRQDALKYVKEYFPNNLDDECLL
jgi:hypothetical protein